MSGSDTLESSVIDQVCKAQKLTRISILVIDEHIQWKLGGCQMLPTSEFPRVATAICSTRGRGRPDF